MLVSVVLASPASAHPLGNFTINHFTRLSVAADRINIRYVVDMAEIPTFQAFQEADSDGDGEATPSELTAFSQQRGVPYTAGLELSLDGRAVPLILRKSQAVTTRAGNGLSTLRLEYDAEASIVAVPGARLLYHDANDGERLGWREIVVDPQAGVQVYDSTAYANSLTDELKVYPDGLLTMPLAERRAELSLTTAAVPATAVALRTREGGVAAPASRDRFVELIAQRDLTLWSGMGALFIAALLGSLHALSPGHGKTVVGAYLVGARGTAKHAAFLGLTVTITHTLGVFALGLITLFASQYILPEQLFPVLSVFSGAIVLVMGLSLLMARTRAAFAPHVHDADEHRHHAHHEHPHPHDHSHDLGHSHDGAGGHDHLPPGADGRPITWRSLLALGISGGIVPCPSALVVLLAAVALNRIAFGLLLIIAFSAGLAAALTTVGLAFVYAGSLMKSPSGDGRLVRALPVLSALVITAIGAVLCHRALLDIGIDVLAPLSSARASWVSMAPILGVGLLFGLKHALDADHLAAVSTIVSERKTFFSATLTGAMWGIGHTLSLLVAGVAVILLHVEIGERTAQGLEFMVALMLVWLGANAIWKLARGGQVHLHEHGHGSHLHLHPHVHGADPEPHAQTHHGLRFNLRPLVVGMVHGLAGSAALMLLVLTTIPSPIFGLAYIAVFGIGSIGGMMVMSLMVGLPLQLTAERFTRAHVTVRTLAALFSVGLGMSMVYEIGIVGGLFAL